MQTALCDIVGKHDFMERLHLNTVSILTLCFGCRGFVIRDENFIDCVVQTEETCLNECSLDAIKPKRLLNDDKCFCHECNARKMQSNAYHLGSDQMY